MARDPIAGREKLGAAWREFNARLKAEKQARHREAVARWKTRQAKVSQRSRKARKHTTAPSTLTQATMRDVRAMERAFREAMAE